MIASTFFDLAEYADQAIDRALPSEPSFASPPLSSTSSTPGIPGTAAPPVIPITPDNISPDDVYAAATKNCPTSEPEATMKELDMLLPQVCEALVLLTQCLITLALTSEDPEFDFPDGDNPKDFFNSAMVDEGHGLCEALISTPTDLNHTKPPLNQRQVF
jgi:ataxin-10